MQKKVDILLSHLSKKWNFLIATLAEDIKLVFEKIIQTSGYQQDILKPSNFLKDPFYKEKKTFFFSKISVFCHVF